MPRRRDIVRALVFTLPFALLFFFVRFVAMRSGDVRAREMGSSYGSSRVEGKAASYDVVAPGPDPSAHARGAALLLDAALEDVIAREGERLGLRAPGRTVRLIVCESDADFQRRSALTSGERLVHNAGYFDPGLMEIALVEEGSPDAFARGLEHEGTHLLLHVAASSGDISHWLNEGLACYEEGLATASLRPGGVAGGVSPREGRLRMLRKIAQAPTERPDIDALLRTRGASFTGAGNAHSYRDAELLVTWLLDAAPQTQREGFIRYVRQELAQGPGDAYAFITAIGLEAKTLEQRLRAWVDGDAR